VRTWDFPNVGVLSVTAAEYDDLDDVDARWPALREQADPDGNDPARGWVWSRIAQSCPERFAVRDRSGAIIALWASTKDAPLRLQEGPAYRLDWFEVRADLRSGGRGAACVHLIALRALDCGADRIVLAAHPNARTLQFYDELGAERRLPRGWKPGRDLVAYVVGPDRLTEMKDLADDLET